MIKIRPSNARGHANHGWLNSRHSFSFGEYYDPNHVHFGPLRVINEDRVVGGGGFGTHPHRDMEIISYVVSGALQHRDNMGNGTSIVPGDVQLMSAGTGVAHSEFNASANDPVHFLQIWIVPAHKGTRPGYQQAHFAPETRRNKLRLVVSPDGADGSLVVGQDARLFAGLIDAGQEVALDLAPGRRAWVQVVGGALALNGTPLAAGDGAAVEGIDRLTLAATADAEVLVFDLPSA